MTKCYQEPLASHLRASESLKLDTLDALMQVSLCGILYIFPSFRHNVMSVILIQVLWECPDGRVQHLLLHRGWRSPKLQSLEIVGKENGHPRLDPGKLRRVDCSGG